MISITLQFGDKSIDLPIPTEYNRIGISMSGGMDSTLLAAMLFPKLDHGKITIYTVEQRNNVQTVKAILKKLSFDSWGKEIDIDHVIITDPKNVNGALSPIFVDICNTVDYLYTGITKNPPWADDIPDGQKPHRFNKLSWQNMLMPFGLTTKDEILQLYQQFDYGDLLTFTHTCTERPDGELSCGTCFACQERMWAFDKLNYSDQVQYE
jgi:7-cyano-7-deazaguanine synthase in queuosine biosynthesis